MKHKVGPMISWKMVVWMERVICNMNFHTWLFHCCVRKKGGRKRIESQVGKYGENK